MFLGVNVLRLSEHTQVSTGQNIDLWTGYPFSFHIGRRQSGYIAVHERDGHVLLDH
jgi:hypothetical protein